FKVLAIGNVTSQILANIYLDELDQYAEHGLKIKNYFRYTDDIVLVHQDREYLEGKLRSIELFLNQELDLKLHPNKIILRKLSQGVDFLGYVILPYYKVLRTKTKKRMFKKLALKQKLLEDGKITEKKYNQAIQSYLGTLGHCQGYGLEVKIRNLSG
ncbi:MAG: RNA-directed DNA polymerase, partial [Patescibacteria group bacterium]